MKLSDLSKHTSRWFSEKGPMSEIIISSRIRLARNLAKHDFFHHCGEQEKSNITEKLRNVLLEINPQGGMTFFDLDHASRLDRDFLVERHLISTHHARAKGARGVVVEDDEFFAAMINEEDHLRMQVLMPGLQLDKCWEKISNIDNQVEKKVEYAFNPELGYLTACPTNVGTGIRVSVMVHLPALKLINQTEKLFKAARDMNLAVRGLFGEGTEAVGDFFQISNQVTLGIS
jgi:protein arginine kinase